VNRTLARRISLLVLFAGAAVGQDAPPTAKSIPAADPCLKKNLSKAEVRTCYANEQQRVTEEADSVVHKIILIFRDDAKSPQLKGHVSSDLRNSASALERSQAQWKAYREQYCHAVQYSYTVNTPEREWGYEQCVFQDARSRLQQLRSDFAGVGSIGPDDDSASTAR
jgi:uncharacterized protein YecT (DUF1311 family)